MSFGLGRAKIDARSHRAMARLSDRTGGPREMVVRSPYPDVVIPSTSLTAFVLEHADRLGDKPALIDGPSGRTMTYGGLSAGIRRLSAGLAEHGLRKGQVVAIFAPNLPEWPLVFHGIAAAGGVVTTINS